MLADLDCSVQPQTQRDRAALRNSQGSPIHLCGDQHLAVVVKHGIREFGDGPYAFTSPALVNTIYGRWWHPLDEKLLARIQFPDPLPWTGDFRDGLGNRISMMAYANPPNINQKSSEPMATASRDFLRSDRHAGMLATVFQQRFRKKGQFPGWPMTVKMDDNDGRKPWGYLPTLRKSRGR
ncbi:MAG: hypothetical protein U0894_03115 [Pirellulales bacterium]